MKKLLKTIIPSRIKEIIKKVFIQDDISKTKIKKMLAKETPIILEIGSNDGNDTEEFLKIFKNLKIFCFEPDLRALTKFKKRINDPRCTLYKYAISDVDGKTDFHLSGGWDMEGGWDMSSSIKKPKKHLERWPEVTFDEKRIINTKKLDTWVHEMNIDVIDFIWADVQGAERELIKGGLKTLNERTRYFYTEFYNEEMYENQATLDDLCELLPNFQLSGVYGDNALFENKNFKSN